MVRVVTKGLINENFRELYNELKLNDSMKMKMKKIDIAVLIAVLLVASIFFYKAGYIPPSPPPKPLPPVPPEGNETVAEKVPTPPSSFIMPSRRAITSDDEGCHYKSLLINREWWYFSAIFDSEDSELKDWGIVVSFKHLAYGDLFGELKPDVLTVVLFDDKGNVYGGVINERRGTLDATSPGVDLKFKNSWAQGEYPRWHLHAETRDVGDDHRIVIDLDYEAHHLPIWVYDTRLFNKSKSKLASYVILGCNVSGKIKMDGKTYVVEGTGFHEHSWSPTYIKKWMIDGWDWIQLKLENGWIIYISKFYPPSNLLSKISPFGKIILTPDGESITEFKTFSVDAKSKDKIFLFTKFPARFSISAKKTHNILLERIDLKLNIEIETTSTFQKVWKFPTYVGFKMGGCKATGTISWLEDGEEVSLDLSGTGTIWTTRLL